MAIKSNESKEHYFLKNCLMKSFNTYSENVLSCELEKRIYTRRADIFITSRDSKNIAIEIQRSIIPVQELIQRTRDYNKEYVYVLWILVANSKCVGSKRTAKNSKNVKVSPLEKYLHKLYGGRVYYIKTKSKSLQKRITPLLPSNIFALNFSPALKKRYRNRRFQNGFSPYYIMNQNVVEIPSLDLLCSESNGVKIARFYDKNFNNLVKQEILKFSKQLSFQRNLTGKALLNRILKQFRKIYDKPVFYRALLYLIDKGFLNIPTNLIKKSNKCYYWLPRGCM